MLYSFDITKVEFISGNGKNHYFFAYNPSNTTDNKSLIGNTVSEDIREKFKEWIDLVKKLNLTIDDYFNPDKKFYNEQFQEYFSNEEPDAATAPYDLQRQAFLNQFLTYAEITVQAANDILQKKKDEIIKDIQDLKIDIPVTSKKTTVSRLSKIARKIFNASNKAFYTVFDVLKRKLLKKVFMKVITTCSHLLMMLPNG
jgi:hypothetical protein